MRMSGDGHHGTVIEGTAADSSSESEYRVFLISADKALRQSQQRLLRSRSITCGTYSSLSDFLGSYRGEPGGLSVDARVSACGPREIIAILEERSVSLPLIILTEAAFLREDPEGMASSFDVVTMKMPVRSQEFLNKIRRFIPSFEG